MGGPGARSARSRDQPAGNEAQQRHRAAAEYLHQRPAQIVLPGAAQLRQGVAVEAGPGLDIAHPQDADDTGYRNGVGAARAIG